MKPGLHMLAVVASGLLFGFGLALSTMIQPEIVLGFLRWRDAGLLLVLGGALAVTLAVYQLLPRGTGRPWLAERFEEPPAEKSRRETLAGAALFGIGWGISGVCPAPAVAALGTGQWSVGWALLGMLAGAYVHGRWLGGRS